MALKLSKGTQATKEFYDRIGWKRRGGTLVDTALFAGTLGGPIQQSMDRLRRQRISEMIGGPGLRLVELGCGGTPAVFLAGRCKNFTAVDFTSSGLSEATIALESAKLAFKTVEADITDLPFDDGEFDAVYSAHVIYHIDHPDGQAAAFREAMRVLRPGGRAVFVLANPFPLLFPYTVLRRVLAMTPGISTLLNRMRTKPPLPYLPMPLGWLKTQLEKWGDVEITSNTIPSTWFTRVVSERTTLGRKAWQMFQSLETNHPKNATRLGCFVTISVVRSTPEEST